MYSCSATVNAFTDRPDQKGILSFTAMQSNQTKPCKPCRDRICILQALNEYNETNAVMDLVLFEDAMKHVCRISRIISSPRYTSACMTTYRWPSVPQLLLKQASVVALSAALQAFHSTAFGGAQHSCSVCMVKSCPVIQ